MTEHELGILTNISECMQQMTSCLIKLTNPPLIYNGDTDKIELVPDPMVYHQDHLARIADALEKLVNARP